MWSVAQKEGWASFIGGLRIPRDVGLVAEGSWGRTWKSCAKCEISAWARPAESALHVKIPCLKDWLKVTELEGQEGTASREPKVSLTPKQEFFPFTGFCSQKSPQRKLKSADPIVSFLLKIFPWLPIFPAPWHGTQGHNRVHDWSKVT